MVMPAVGAGAGAGTGVTMTSAVGFLAGTTFHDQAPLPPSTDTLGA